MIIALFSMLILARFTWILAEKLQAESERLRHQIINEMDIEFKRALLERCLYRTMMMIEIYGDD